MMSLARAIDVYYRYRKRKETYLRGSINLRNHSHVIPIDHMSVFEICNYDEKKKLIRQLEQESVTIYLLLKENIKND